MPSTSETSVGDPESHMDPDPWDTYVIEPPGSASGSDSHMYGSGS